MAATTASACAALRMWRVAKQPSVKSAPCAVAGAGSSCSVASVASSTLANRSDGRNAQSRASAFAAFSRTHGCLHVSSAVRAHIVLQQRQQRVHARRQRFQQRIRQRRLVHSRGTGPLPTVVGPRIELESRGYSSTPAAW